MTDCSAGKAEGNLKPLKRGDSGYLSPVACSSASEHLTHSRNNSFPHSGDVSSPSRSRSTPTIVPNGTEEMLHNGGAVATGSSLALDDIKSWAGLDMKNLQLAFKCREDNCQAWKNCTHSYCNKTRTIWNHWSSCYDGANACATCRNFEDLSCRHSGCSGESTCPIPSCRSGKKRLRQVKYSACNNLGGLGAIDSMGDMVSEGGPHPPPEQNLIGKLTHYSEDLYHSLLIGEMAEKIVRRLDEEQPLLPESYNSMPSSSVPIGMQEQRPHPILVPGIDTTHYQLTSLYPIVERSEDTLSPPYSKPRSLYNSAYHGHSCGSISLELDDIVVGNVSMNGMPSTSTNSLAGEEDGETIYPHQTVMFGFNKDTLTLGSDTHYYQRRDYNANDILLGTGGFGSILCCKDLTSNQLFAVKQNKRDDPTILDSINTEASLLSRLGQHRNVIQMYGAVVDVQESEFQPTKMYKMMMELAEHGNLSSMLVDPDTDEPFPLCRDQALYYFWQLLEGVRFLHDNNVLHLDIKGLNLLVFDQGKTLKLCDFGTAIRMDDASSIGKNLCTPQFAAPEICKQKQPRFSSDIWSCMCVLVEMLTASKPWQRIVRDGTNAASIIFTVGSYKEEDMENSLIPCVETEPIDSDLLDMMRLVFKADHTQRSTALELLQHPLVVDAYKYVSEFDEANSCEDDVPNETEPPSPFSIPTSGPIPDSADIFVQNTKRISKDSRKGTSIDLDTEAYQSSYGRTTSSGRNSDSGVDSPSTDKTNPFNACAERSGKDFTAINNRVGVCDDPTPHHSQHHRHILTSSNNFDGSFFSSLPNPASTRKEHVIPVQSSFSITCPGSSTTSSIYSSLPPCGSNHGNVIMMHQCSCSALAASPSLCTILKHSNSAPSFGCNYRKRRLSLQTMKSYRSDSGMCEGEMQTDGRLRRSSSEVYAVKGPDIDSPKGINKLLGEEVSADDLTQKEVSTAAEPAGEKQPLQVSRETDHLMAKECPPAPPSTAGTSLTSFRDTAISSEAIPSESSCCNFEATLTPPESVPVNQGTPLVSEEHVQEASGRDSNRVEGVNGKLTSMIKTVNTHGTLYEHLL